MSSAVDRNPNVALAAVCLGFLMITLDATIVNVALAPIVTDLGGSVASAQWIVSGYTLAFAALLLSAGGLADRIGARAGYLIGLGIFAAGSAICSAAPSLSVLIAARIVQGTGAAWLMPCSLALISHAYPEGPRRRGALAIWGGASGVGLAAGPVLGGAITALVGWRGIFLVNLPVASVAAALLIRHLEETPRHRHPADPVGLVLSVAALSLLTSGFILAGRPGGLGGPALSLLGGGAAASFAFVTAERRGSHPMADPALFARRSFRLSVAVAVIFNFTLYGGLFCLALDLGAAHGLGAFDTGLAMLPVTLVTGGTAYLSGRLIARLGEWPVIAAGFVSGVAGSVLVAANGTHGPLVLLVLGTLPLGLAAMAMPAMTATAMAEAPAGRVGLASGVLNAARQTGGAFGVAVLGALLQAGGHPQLHTPYAAAAALYAAGAVIALMGRAVSERAR